jgi:hypothetical protein
VCANRVFDLEDLYQNFHIVKVTPFRYPVPIFKPKRAFFCFSRRYGLAGAFGHIPVHAAGPLCGCGKRGCWETLASCDAALRFYSELSLKAPVTSIHSLMHLAKEGDKLAVEAIKKQALHLGRGLRLVTAVLSRTHPHNPVLSLPPGLL